jgi:hypothetical protein
MAVSDADIQKYAHVVRWALENPENQKSLSPELKVMLELIQAKLDALKPKEKMRIVFAINNSQFALTPQPLPYYIRT